MQREARLKTRVRACKQDPVMCTVMSWRATNDMIQIDHFLFLLKTHMVTRLAWFTAFQSEWEALEIVEHKWALENIEEELMSRDLNFRGLFSQNQQGKTFWSEHYSRYSTGV